MGVDLESTGLSIPNKRFSSSIPPTALFLALSLLTLSLSSDYFEALAHLIELNRRTGKLAMAVPYLEQAKSVCSNSALEPGMNYCRALLKW